ncbi:hypothetical protein TNCT_382101 [Trichonephila clavata]|uniref:Uncharacterized protein n=1 Tax=Trichonephila clavata TaxID=2740835 RepID=A0A8X6GPJ7_TRICU|nr:hypothetical protein TNCT_382101 [Trichonephila clavata]
MVYGTSGSLISNHMEERVAVGSKSASHTSLQSSRFVVFLIAPDPVTARKYNLPCSLLKHFLEAHFELCTGRATRQIDQPVVFILMIGRLTD